MQTGKGKENNYEIKIIFNDEEKHRLFKLYLKDISEDGFQIRFIKPQSTRLSVITVDHNRFINNGSLSILYINSETANKLFNCNVSFYLRAKNNKALMIWPENSDFLFLENKVNSLKVEIQEVGQYKYALFFDKKIEKADKKMKLEDACVLQ